MGRNRKTSDPQFEFLLEVIQAIEDSRGDEQVVYPLLAANTDKINDRLAKLLHVVGTSILEKGEIYETALLLGYIGDLSTLIAQFPLGDKARNMEIAITGNKIVLTFFTREVCAEKWALTQNNLGGAYIDRRKGKKAQNIEQAIACYQQALRVYTF
ncbi:MAG: tetratricopeptide repeat protein [Moorea sp. SIO4A5]|nr:tetratricopeptide repeat protein [Moorena sp. SIO4A5]